MRQRWWASPSGDAAACAVLLVVRDAAADSKLRDYVAATSRKQRAPRQALRMRRRSVRVLVKRNALQLPSANRVSCAV